MWRQIPVRMLWRSVVAPLLVEQTIATQKQRTAEAMDGMCVRPKLRRAAQTNSVSFSCSATVVGSASRQSETGPHALAARFVVVVGSGARSILGRGGGKLR